MSLLGNIRIEKIWEDEHIFQIKLSVNTEYVDVWQICYFDATSFNKLCVFLLDYCKGNCNADYYESGNKQGNYTPSFSMSLSNDRVGHIIIEMDLEINDVTDRSHRCICNVYTELGLLQQFAIRMEKIIDSKVGYAISLLDE